MLTMDAATRVTIEDLHEHIWFSEPTPELPKDVIAQAMQRYYDGGEDRCEHVQRASMLLVSADHDLSLLPALFEQASALTCSACTFGTCPRQLHLT